MTWKKTAGITNASLVTPMKTKEDLLYTEEWISKTDRSLSTTIIT